MQGNDKLTKASQNHQRIVEVPNSLSKKIPFGAPNGPRRPRNEKYDGHEPLEYPGLEAVAQYLATPKSLREFKSDSDLAKHFHVTRMTIHRAKKDVDVIKRAHWLSMRNKLAGDLILRREYPSIIEKAVELAKEGKIKVMEFCVDRAFPRDQESPQSLSLKELVLTNDDEIVIEPDDLKKTEGRQAAESKVAERSHPLEEPKEKPE